MAIALEERAWTRRGKAKVVHIICDHAPHSGHPREDRAKVQTDVDRPAWEAEKDGSNTVISADLNCEVYDQGDRAADTRRFATKWTQWFESMGLEP